MFKKLFHWLFPEKPKPMVLPTVAPREYYRLGRYFIIRDGYWWAVCADTSEGPEVMDETALFSTAVRVVREAADRIEQGVKNDIANEHGNHQGVDGL